MAFRCHSRPGFTLVEAMVALSITLLAGSVMLLSIEGSVQATDSAVEETIAQGMAEQIVDEVMGCIYKATTAGPYQWPLTPSGWEANGNGRERFDDTDDFNGFSTVGAEDIWGRPLGQGDDEGGLRHAHFRVRNGFFSKWRQDIEVYYVSDSDTSVRLSAGQTSNYRAVEVVISRELYDGAIRELARVRRVYAYIPSPT